MELERLFEQLEIVGVRALDVQPEAFRVCIGETPGDRRDVGRVNPTCRRQQRSHPGHPKAACLVRLLRSKPDAARPAWAALPSAESAVERDLGECALEGGELLIVQ